MVGLNSEEVGSGYIAKGRVRVTRLAFHYRCREEQKRHVSRSYMGADLAEVLWHSTQRG